MYAFEEFPKIPRLKREVVITEKVDGTNAQIAWVPITGDEIATDPLDGNRGISGADAFRTDPFCLAVLPGINDGDSAVALYAGSRTRWLDTSSKGDNFGFAKWVFEHKNELRALGPGRHYGEWYGQGIQRNYGLTEKRFALFNVGRWNVENRPPACCSVVPVLARGKDADVDSAMQSLKYGGSVAVPGFMNPEGVVVYHSAARQMYKVTFKDDGGKWRGEPKNIGMFSGPDQNPNGITV